MMKQKRFRFTVFLIMVSLLISACSGASNAKPTEQEIVIDPNEGQEEPAAPVSTPTLRPIPTATIEPEIPTAAPTPTETLSPYDTLIFEGIQLRIDEQVDAAIAKFAEAIQMDPTNPEAYIERGIVYSTVNKQDEAIADFNFAINYDPTSAKAYNARGVAWAQKASMPSQLKITTKSIELQPDYHESIYQPGDCQYTFSEICRGAYRFCQGDRIDPGRSRGVLQPRPGVYAGL